MKIEVDRRDLEKIERDLNKAGDAVSAAVADSSEVLREIWVNAAEFVGARESGDYIRSLTRKNAKDLLAEMRPNAFDFVRSDVGYSGWIESGSEKMRGRHVAERALNEFDQRDEIEKQLDRHFDKILQK